MDVEVMGLYVLGGLILLIGFTIVLCIIRYILNGVALYRISKKLGIAKPWLSWVPIANLYIRGKIAGDKVDIEGKEINRVSRVSLYMFLGVIIYGIIIYNLCLSIESRFIVQILTTTHSAVFVANLVLYYFILYKTFKMLYAERAIRNIVLSVLIPISEPFLFLNMSKKEPNLEIYNE